MPCTVFPKEFGTRIASYLVPTSRWERSIMKLCFTAMKLEKQDAVYERSQTEFGNEK